MAQEFEAKENKEFMTETLTGERIFEYEGRKMKIRFPNNQESQLADIEYSKAFTELMDTNLKTRAEMEELLEKRKIWTAEDERKIQNYQKSITDALEKLSKAKSNKEAQKQREEIVRLRKEIQKTQAKREAYLNNTIESRAENTKMGYIIHCVTFDLDSGERVWKKYNDFVTEDDQGLLYKVILEYMTFASGVPSSFLEQSPLDTEQQEENGEPDGE